MSRVLLVSILLASISPVMSEEVSGPARVIDGDTIEIGAAKIRLHGIDAPEGAQTCKTPAGGSHPCGDAATKRLREMIGTHHVVCRSDERDHYGRLVAVCSARGLDLNRALVREGFAWAFVKYSHDYVRDEAEAIRAKRGVFAAKNIPPWDFRAGRWGEAEKEAAKGCAIKGNVNRGGERIYHMPWQRDYAKVNMSKGMGERWFCDEGEAEKAGWRRAAR